MPPIIQLFVFAYAATLDVKATTIGILNRDNGEQAFELVERFYGAPIFEKIISLKAVEEIGPFLDRQEGLLVVSIDEEFSRNLDRNKQATVQLICDGRKSNTNQILSGYATQLILEYSSELEERVSIPQQNVALVPRNWFNPNITYLWYNITCLVGTLSMLTCLIVISQSVAREREMGTFDQLLVSPLTPLEILIGKIVPGILVGFAEGSVMWISGTLILGVPFHGSILLFILSMLTFMTAISGVGFFISSLCSTQQQALLGTFLFMTPSVLLSGFGTPIENMPTWLQPVTFLMPLRYMLVLTKGLFLKNLSPALVFEQLWPMLLISLFTLGIASRFFRSRVKN